MRSLKYYDVTYQGNTYKFKKQKDIAEAFGVHPTTINLILNNKYKAKTDIHIQVKYDEPKTEKVEN